MEPGDVSAIVLIFCPLAMYIVASEGVDVNTLDPKLIPVTQLVDGRKVTVVSEIA